MQGVTTIKIPVPVLAEALRDQISPMSGWNGDLRYFCDLLRDHYQRDTIEVSTSASSADVGRALKKLGEFNLPNGAARRHFEAMTDRLIMANTDIELQFADAN